MRQLLSRSLGSDKKTNRPARPKSTSLHVEALEKRDLLAVAAPTLTNGVLRVAGDGANDQIEIRETTSGPIILLSNPGVTATKTIITVKDLTRATNNTWTFDRSQVQRIEVDMGDGDDRLVSDSTASTTVSGGVGNDYAETGNANDLHFGGAGNDTLNGNDGDDQVFGEDGDDLLIGASGNDTLGGGAGADVLFAGTGNDKLTGDDNATVNQLFGEGGDDSIDSWSRLDLVDGGAGRDTLFVQAGTQGVLYGEDLTINTPGDQPQTDGISCGPNSGSRWLRSYGIDASYDLLRRKVKSQSLIYKARLGTRPSTLRDLLKRFKSDVRLRTKASLTEVLDQLAAGKPVIALVAPRSNTLHYVVLNGVDLDNRTIRYVDTSGLRKTWTYEEFDNHWQWTNHFKGIVGRTMRLFVKLAGVETRTYLS